MVLIVYVDQGKAYRALDNSVLVICILLVLAVYMSSKPITYYKEPNLMLFIFFPMFSQELAVFAILAVVAPQKTEVVDGCHNLVILEFFV